MTFELEIITPETSENITVFWIEIESPTGSFLIGPDHSPLISVIKKKSIFSYKAQNNEEHTREATAGGIIKITENKAFILLDH